MYAVEFDTKIDNGFIQIPTAYNELNGVNAKLLLW